MTALSAEYQCSTCRHYSYVAKKDGKTWPPPDQIPCDCHATSSGGPGDNLCKGFKQLLRLVRV